MVVDKLHDGSHKRIHIGIDLMGAEVSAASFLEALDLLHQNSSISDCVFHLFGTSNVIHDIQPRSWIVTHVCEKEISMKQTAKDVLQNGKNSSIYTGIEHVKDGTLDAFFSCGNTIALVCLTNAILRPYTEVMPLALCTQMPKISGHFCLLDTGACITVSWKTLVSYAFLGAAAYSSVFIKNRPIRVGLLNIGEESIRGLIIQKKAYTVLQEYKDILPFEFVGNIEPKKIFLEDAVDVVVTDGFSGNIFLKTAEATSEFILKQLINENRSQSVTELLKKQVHGALLLGTNGLIAKAHGAANTEALVSSLTALCTYAKNHTLVHMNKMVTSNLSSLQKILQKE